MQEIKPTVIRSEAREVLCGRWKFSAIAIACLILPVVVAAMTILIHPLIYMIAMLGVIPIGIGLWYFFLDMVRGKQVGYSEIFSHYGNFVRIFILLLLFQFAVMIGMFLFVVPGVILWLGLSMSFFILRDRPELSVVQVMQASWQMMVGHKRELGLLLLSFTGWIFLAVCSFGVGVFLLYPYILTSVVCFYEKIRCEGECEDDGVVHLSQADF